MNPLHRPASLLFQVVVVGMLSGSRHFLAHALVVRPSSSSQRLSCPFPAVGRIRRALYASSATADDGDETDQEALDSIRPTTTSDDDATTDPLAEYRNPKNRRDQIFSAISGDGGIKVTTGSIRNLLNDMMIQQGLNSVPAQALGRTVTCALLLANGIQDEQVFQITVNSDGPLRGVVGIANGKGHVRGYVGTPGLGDVPLTTAIGQGSIQIVKNHPDWPRPYNGITAIRHSDVDRDIGIYLADSEQRSCALAAATSVNEILCTASGGYLIEQLPGVEAETVAAVERNLAKLVAQDGGDELPTNLLLAGVTPLDMAQTLLEGLDLQPLQQIEPTLSCDCSEDRLFRALRLLPREEVEDILAKEEEVSARCHFCGQTYRMAPDDLRKRLDQAKGDPARDEEKE
jgi:molecular chaperone Hsp33